MFGLSRGGCRIFAATAPCFVVPVRVRHQAFLGVPLSGMSLSITFSLPVELEARLRRESRDLSADVKEAFALELFRRGTLSHYELSVVL